MDEAPCRIDYGGALLESVIAAQTLHELFYS